GRTPDQQSHRLAVQRHHLPKVVSDGAASSQVMMLPQLLVEPWDVFRRGDPNFQFSSTAAGRFKINRVFHPSLADLKTGFLSSPNFDRSAGRTYANTSKDPGVKRELVYFAIDIVPPSSQNCQGYENPRPEPPPANRVGHRCERSRSRQHPTPRDPDWDERGAAE